MNKQKGISQIAVMIIMLILAIALPITTRLVQQVQENRSKATTNVANGSCIEREANTCIGNAVYTCKPYSETSYNYFWQISKTCLNDSTCVNGACVAATCSSKGGTCVTSYSQVTSGVVCSGSSAGSNNGSINLGYSCSLGQACCIPNKTSVSCTSYTTGSWSTCINGTQVRNVVGVPAGCVGGVAKPDTSQACKITPTPIPTTKPATGIITGSINGIYCTDATINTKLCNGNAAYICKYTTSEYGNNTTEKYWHLIENCSVNNKICTNGSCLSLFPAGKDSVCTTGSQCMTNKCLSGNCVTSGSDCNGYKYKDTTNGCTNGYVCKQQTDPDWGLLDVYKCTAPTATPTVKPIATATPTVKPIATATPTVKPIATATPVPGYVAPSLNFMFTVSGVKAINPCFGSLTFKVNVAKDGQTGITRDITAVAVDQFNVNGDQVFKITGFALDNTYALTDKIKVFVSGKKTLATMYGKDDQSSGFGALNQSQILVSSLVGGSYLNFVEYPVLNGDVGQNGQLGVQDGVVNGIDFSYMRTQWGRTCNVGENLEADLNGDCRVDTFDLQILKNAMAEQYAQKTF